MKKIRILSITIVVILIGVIASTYIHKPKSIDNKTEPVISNEEHASVDKSKEEVVQSEDLLFLY